MRTPDYTKHIKLMTVFNSYSLDWTTAFQRSRCCASYLKTLPCWQCSEVTGWDASLSSSTLLPGRGGGGGGGPEEEVGIEKKTIHQREVLPSPLVIISVMIIIILAEYRL